VPNEAAAQVARQAGAAEVLIRDMLARMKLPAVPVSLPPHVEWFYSEPCLLRADLTEDTIVYFGVNDADIPLGRYGSYEAIAVFIGDSGIAKGMASCQSRFSGVDARRE
jgi:hypothetical protein